MKKSVCITVDEEIWEAAGEKLDSRSDFCESQLKLFLELNTDAEDEILQQIQDKRDEINVLEDKLCVLDGSMVSINRLHGNLGHVGKNQIKRIAKSNGVPFDLLLEHCRVSGLNVVNFAEVPKK